MTEGASITYVGNPDIHDGRIVRLRSDSDTTCVTVQSASGRLFDVEFRRVASVRANRAEGMVLYALCEIRAPQSLRRFQFANWDSDDDAFLEVVAEEFRIIEGV